MKKIISISITTILLCFLINPFQNAKAEVQSSITRSQAEQRALSMINLKWTYSSNINGNINSKSASTITQPKQFKNVSSAELTGIPYNWGGLDGLDSNSYNAPWSNFLDAISKGAYAGNVNTEAGYGYISGTAGIDCSGFVQATFNIQDYKQSTSSLFDKYFTKISLDDIKHMDILDKPADHVVIFDKWGTLNGIYGAYTYESTTDDFYGGIQGTKKYFLSMDEINKGYIPGRYVNLVEDTQNTSSSNMPYPVSPGIFAQVANVNNYANFRANASLDSSIIGTIPKGTILYLIDYSSGWYEVSYGGQVGWIYGNLISSIPTGKYVTLNNAYQLNIRSNPTTSSSIIGVLNINQYAEVSDYSADGNWFKIKINGVEGWAYKKYLSYIY